MKTGSLGMNLTRRKMIGCIAAAGVVYPFSRTAAAQDAGKIILKPITANSRENSLYANLANAGDFGLPDSAVSIKLYDDLTVVVFTPKQATKTRLVVFSHSELALPHVYEPILSHWASHGYTIVCPIHDDSVINDGLKALKTDVLGATWDISVIVDDPEAWKYRAVQCSRTLDNVAVIARTLEVEIDAERPIIAGHSYGDFTTQLLLGGRALTGTGETLSAFDDRFFAGILLSPTGRGMMGLTNGSWDYMAAPCLSVTGEGDHPQDPQVKIEPYLLSPPNNKHLAWFQKISPAIYTGQQIVRETPGELIFLDLLSVTTAFLRSYASYDQEVFKELVGNYFQRYSSQRVIMYYR